MIEKIQIFLNLDMSHVVPIADVRRGDFIEQLRDFAFRRNLFVAATPLDSETGIFSPPPVQRSAGAFLHPGEMRRCRHSRAFALASIFSNIYLRESNPPFCASAINSSVIGFIGVEPQCSTTSGAFNQRGSHRVCSVCFTARSRSLFEQRKIRSNRVTRAPDFDRQWTEIICAGC